MRIAVLVVLFFPMTAVVGSRQLLAQEIRSSRQSSEYHRAETAWRSGGSLLEAKARLDNLIEELPDDADARKLRAKVLLALERPDDAFTDARRAAVLRPEDGEANLLVTRSARLIGDTTTAVAALKRAYSTISPDAEAHVRLSVESMELERYEEAESLARVAIALDALNGEARMQLARVLGVRGDLASATKALEAAADLSLVTPERIASDPVLDTTGVARRFLSGLTKE